MQETKRYIANLEKKGYKLKIERKAKKLNLAQISKYLTKISEVPKKVENAAKYKRTANNSQTVENKRAKIVAEATDQGILRKLKSSEIIGKQLRARGYKFCCHVFIY